MCCQAAAICSGRSWTPHWLRSRSSATRSAPTSHSFHGSPFALAVGILGSVYGGLGIAQATQQALNKVWAVPRNARPNPVKARLRSLLLVGAGGAAVVATAVLSALSAAANAYGASLGVLVRAIATVLAVALNVVLFMGAFRRAYESYPKTERHKGFERVDVDFDQPRQSEPGTPES